ncbi:MAG: hypothetical protein D6713_01165 [Deltaproteobacteria bacterium]|nr:MAG: hypothetical protein D6713_01165 [Deltaproteobacteria bacterium]
MRSLSSTSLRADEPSNNRASEPPNIRTAEPPIHRSSEPPIHRTTGKAVGERFIRSRTTSKLTNLGATEPPSIRINGKHQ